MHRRPRTAVDGLHPPHQPELVSGRGVPRKDASRDPTWLPGLRTYKVEDVLVPRRFSLLVAIVTSLVLLSSLSVATVSAAHHPGAHIFVFALTPEAEEPLPGDLGASGTAAILVVPAADLICYRLTWQDIEGSVVGAHIHEAPVGVDNPAPLVGLIDGTFSGAAGSYQACTRSAEADAIAENPENYYVNIHSTEFPGGAIRGQLA